MGEAQWIKTKKRLSRQKHGIFEVELKECGHSILSIMRAKEKWADEENLKDCGSAAVSQSRVN